MSRKVTYVIRGVEQREGQGAKVIRTIGSYKCENLDPFLLLDEFMVAKPAGFPDHPHRGFETVTMMISGAFEHQDFIGNRGIIRPGDIQWMTAGRGVVHSEVPVEDGINHGIQLWVNLKKSDKMIAPSYQDLSNDKIPVCKKDGVTVRIIAGESMGTKGLAITRTPSMFLHFFLAPEACFTQEIPETWTGFAYVTRGVVEFGPKDETKEGKEHCLVVFSTGNVLEMKNKGTEEAELVLICGEPIQEPIVKQGPFVMNTQAEIRQAIQDYQTAKNGFEPLSNNPSEPPRQ